MWLSSPKIRRSVVLLGFVLVFAMSPVWFVDHFVNQDGSAHVHTAHLMSRILTGDREVSEIYAFNSIAVPNSTGHWFLMILLQIFSPFAATKIIVFLTFAGLVIAVVWLRHEVAGEDGLNTSVLLGCAIAFNWLWLVGFYNFGIGLIVSIFALGLFYRWKEEMTVARTVAIAALILLTYFSHLISFALLSGSLFIVAFTARKDSSLRSILTVILAILPSLPLAIAYERASHAQAALTPVWRSLADPFSLTAWLRQIRMADPFVLISRKTFPFVELQSELFAVFAPTLWIAVVLILLIVSTIRAKARRGGAVRAQAPFFILFLMTGLAALFAPDDFGIARGGILRERLALFTIVFMVPLFASNAGLLKRTAQIALATVIAFQTAVLWEYALYSDKVGREFVASAGYLGAARSNASVTVYDAEPRFHSLPEPQVNGFHAIGGNTAVWDNYEIGHSIFPLIARNGFDKDFVLGLTSSNVFLPSDGPQLRADKMSRLESLLANDGGRLETLLVWGGSPEIDAIVVRYFGPEPFYQKDRIRLFRRAK
jgi:hypothetical protein